MYLSLIMRLEYFIGTYDETPKLLFKKVETTKKSAIYLLKHVTIVRYAVRHQDYFSLLATKTS